MGNAASKKNKKDGRREESKSNYTSGYNIPYNSVDSSAYNTAPYPVHSYDPPPSYSSSSYNAPYPSAGYNAPNQSADYNAPYPVQSSDYHNATCNQGYVPNVQQVYQPSMTTVNSEDITVPWGQSPDPLDFQYGKWRVAVFQDLQESIDQSKLYFLYDPTADDQCITTGSRKSMTCIAVFDVHRKCFVAEIPVRVQGRVKMLFALPQPSSGGGTAFVITSQSEDYGQFNLHVWRFELQSDGVTPVSDPRSLLNSPISVDSDFICSLREDQPELIVVSGPQMNVTCVNASATSPQPPANRFSVAGAELSHFYDGFLSRGNVYFLSASPDGHLDYSRLHILSLQSQQLTTQFCQPDPARGLPPARKQAALDSTSGFILLAGGEVDYGDGDVQRLVDYWVLDLSSFKWNQIQSQMSVPLIEPRLTTANSGNVYVWGDFDDPLPNMDAGTTHVRILRVRGLNAFNPPPYGAVGSGSQPPYPASSTYPNQQSYGQPQGGYNQGQPQGGYNQGQNYGQPQGDFGQGQNYGQPQGQNYGGPPPEYGQGQNSQYPYYPPQEKKKDCSIS